MKLFFGSKYAPLLLALTVAASPFARATSLSGTALVDDGLYLYISTNNSTLGTEIASIPTSVSWRTAASFSNYTLNPGSTYYLHAEVINNTGPGGFVGQFSLSDAGATFANGTQSLLTNTTDWQGTYNGPDSAGQALPWVTPTGLVWNEQTGGNGPYWGSGTGFQASGISSNAQWLWTMNATSSPANPNYDCQYCMIDLSTTITVAGTSSIGTQSASTPSPSTWALMLIGLAALPLLKRSTLKKSRRLSTPLV